MARLLRHRTIGALIAWSGLISHAISPSYAQVASPHNSSSSTTNTSSHSTITSTAASTNYTGITVIDFGKQNGGTLVLKCDLINSGTLYAISTNPAITTAIFSAANVFNQHGATISSVLPAGGLPGYANAISGLNLLFNVTNNFTNAGTIASAGSLAINAGGTITNALPQGVTGPSPVMQAINNINIMSQIGNIVNAGTIASINGNINLASAASSALTINNVGGIMQALQGSINVRDSLYNGTAALNIIGGDWLSQNLNLNNANGAISAHLNSASGVINVLGSAAEIGVDRGDLLLGNIKIYGDPTYYSADGNVSLPSNINTLGFDLAVIAKNDIVGTGASVAISTGGAASSGNVLMVAGAKFINPTSGTDGPPSSNATKVSWTSPNSAVDAGGSIFINTLTIDTSGTAAHGAGDVTMVAYQGTNALSGQIVVDMKSSSINASNVNSSFSGGNVTLIAGKISGNPIVFGNITGGGGNASIGVFAATPVISGSGTITVLDGTPLPGSGTYSAGQLQNARIDLGIVKNDGAIGLDSVGLTQATNGANGGAITVKSAGDVFIASLLSRGGQGGADAAGLGAAGAGGNGGTIYAQGTNVQTSVVDNSGGKGGLGANTVFLSGNGGKGGSGGFYFGNASASLTLGAFTSSGGDGGVGGTVGPATASGDASGGSGGVAVLNSQSVNVIDVNMNGGAGGSAASGFAGADGSGGGSGGKFIVTANTFQASGNINSKGGAASSGANGSFSNGGNAAGFGGTGGSVQITTSQNITVADVNVSGGAGGNGGAAGSLPTALAGQSSLGGDAGTVNLIAGTGLFAGDFFATGGTGGNGGNTKSAVTAGAPTDGSNGGKGGIITLSGIACCVGNVNASGGTGGSAGADLGVSGKSANGGNGGGGGSISISSTDALDVFGSLIADSGAGGTATNAGVAGGGGNGGFVTLTQTAPVPIPPALNGAIISGSISAKGIGAGNHGGTVSATSNVGLEFDGPLYVTGSNGAAGGTVTIISPNLKLPGVDGSTNASIDASSDKAAGGTITVSLSAAGSGCGCPNEIFGNLIATGAGAGNKGGTISLSAPIALLEVDGFINAAGKNGAAGGSVSVLAKAFAILGSDPITARTVDASSTSASGGTVSIIANSKFLPSIVAGEINVDGSGVGNKAGTATLDGKGSSLEIDGPVNAIGKNGANGGTISVSAVELALTKASVSGNSLDASSTFGSGGFITVSTTGPDPLSNSGCACNFIAGNIAANGAVNGGRINLASTSGFSFETPYLISANGQAGQGGLIQFTSPGSANLIMKNSGVITATNTANNSGRIGFNVGDTGGVKISGAGSMKAGEYVGIGNLDPVTLAVQNPRQVQLSDFPFGNYSFTQLGGVTNKILVSQPLPPSNKPSTTTLIGGVSVQAELPSNLPGASSSSTILKTDQIQFMFSLGDHRRVGAQSNPSSYIDGVLVGVPSDAFKAVGITVASNGDGNLVLSRGNLLVMPAATVDGGMQITTKEGTLFVAPGSIAFLIETGNDVAVYALHEKQAGDITFRSGKQTIELCTGQQAVFTRDKSDFTKVNPGSLIPARKVNSYKMDNGVTAFVADYSMPVALSVIRPLNSLRRSDNTEQRRMSGVIEKNAAILSLLGMKHGPYKQHNSP
jgi:hypothetical protein